MDANRLSETLYWLRRDEDNFGIQGKLIAIQAALQNLTSNPGDQSHQRSLITALDELSSAIDSSLAMSDPSDLDRIIEIGAEPFFTQKMVERIKTQISLNPMSPAVALSDVSTIVAERKSFVQRVRDTEAGIDFFVEYHSDLNPGESEIGFEIPRPLFDNEFKDFIAELRTIQRVIRVFSETSVGSVPEIKLGSISSSDPLIFLHAPPVVVMSVTAAVAWLLNQWKKFEEIRKIRAETAKLEQFKKEELEEFFDKKIRTSLDAAILERVSEILSESKLEQHRKAELESELIWAFNSLFARVERGMRVEVAIKHLDEGAPLTEHQKDQERILKAVDSIRETMTFPRVDAEPILALPRESEKGDGSSKPRQQGAPPKGSTAN